jgi:hypothetical protein
LDGPRSFLWFKHLFECHLNLNPLMLSRQNPSVSRLPIIPPTKEARDLCFSLLLLFRPGDGPLSRGRELR